MTTVPRKAQLPNSDNKECDDLTVIDGIKGARQQWLRESLNVCTYADLAALSPDQIASQSKADEKLIAHKVIEKWVIKARELAAAADLTSQRMTKAALQAAKENPTDMQEPGEWSPFAAFVVEFQARKVDGQEEEQRIEVRQYLVKEDGTWEENGGTENVDVVRGRDLYPWMLDQLGMRAHRPTEPESKAPHKPRPVIASEDAVPQVNVKITQIRAFQPPQAETPVAVGADRQPFRRSLKSGEPFALEAIFELTGPAAADAAKEKTPYHAEFHVRALPTGVTRPLGRTEYQMLTESAQSYSVKLPEIALPQGMYRLQVIMMLESEPPTVSYVKLPLLPVG